MRDRINLTGLPVAFSASKKFPNVLPILFLRPTRRGSILVKTHCHKAWWWYNSELSMTRDRLTSPETSIDGAKPRLF
ncbi:hypothetical protein AMR41_06780 [Hapalosiphon sp. MRB220]|nr:hypothetical protein AMR41_06780 [Hapalosiphon sp. MRB220]